MNSIKNEVQFSKNSLTLENVELSKGYKKSLLLNSDAKLAVLKVWTNCKKSSANSLSSCSMHLPAFGSQSSYKRLFTPRVIFQALVSLSSFSSLVYA